jgi:DNA (cytosine-5)-methyltransferase 1
LKFGSVCSGIEAASVAFEPLGFTAQWFSEIEHFPSEVLKYRYPTVPNLGDMTKLTENETFRASSIDLLVGGTPCQSFSVAGLRGGLADPRGNLMLTFLSLADAKKPRWIVWENVPGVLSSNGGKDFGTFLGALGELGYGFAYRVLDAQHFGVAQRRRRVFVVGYLGDWRVAAAVLFERESLQGNPKPSRKKREEVTPDAEGGVGESGIPRISNALCARDYKGSQPERNQGAPLIIDRAAFNQGENAQYEPRIEEGETMSSLVAKGPHAVAQPIPIHDQATRFNGKRGNKQDGKGNGLGIGQEYDPSPTLTKGDRHAVAQPLYYESHPNDSRVNGPKDVADTVSARYGTGGGNTPLVQQPFRKVRRAQSDSDFETWEKDETANTLNCFDVGDVRSTNVVAQPISLDTYKPPMAIRRLTPIETELLQGFPRNWTQIPYRNKPADQCPDGPRYKACGNSMAVPVMRWIGKRIQLIDTIIN